MYTEKDRCVCFAWRKLKTLQYPPFAAFPPDIVVRIAPRSTLGCISFYTNTQLIARVFLNVECGNYSYTQSEWIFYAPAYWFNKPLFIISSVIESSYTKAIFKCSCRQNTWRTYLICCILMTTSFCFDIFIKLKENTHAANPSFFNYALSLYIYPHQLTVLMYQWVYRHANADNSESCQFSN